MPVAGARSCTRGRAAQRRNLAARAVNALAHVVKIVPVDRDRDRRKLGVSRGVSIHDLQADAIRIAPAARRRNAGA